MENLKKISNNIYILPFNKYNDRPILGFIKGKNFDINIDCGNSYNHAQLFISEINKITTPNIKFSINTHWHWDHCFGNIAFNNDIISSDTTKEKISYLSKLEWDNRSLESRVKSGEEIEFCREHIIKEFPNNKRKIKIKIPNLTFSKKFNLNLGNLNCELIKINCDHSEDSIIAHIKEEKTVFVGDSLYMNMYEGDWYYTPSIFIPYLNQLLSLNANIYIPSHHNIISKKDLINLRNTAQTIIDLLEENNYCKAKVINKLVNIYKKTIDNEIEEILDGFINNNKRR